MWLLPSLYYELFFSELLSLLAAQEPAPVAHFEDFHFAENSLSAQDEELLRESTRLLVNSVNTVSDSSTEDGSEVVPDNEEIDVSPPIVTESALAAETDIESSVTETQSTSEIDLNTTNASSASEIDTSTPPADLSTTESEVVTSDQAVENVTPASEPLIIFEREEKEEEREGNEEGEDAEEDAVDVPEDKEEQEEEPPIELPSTSTVPAAAVDRIAIAESRGDFMLSGDAVVVKVPKDVRILNETEIEELQEEGDISASFLACSLTSLFYTFTSFYPIA